MPSHNDPIKPLPCVGSISTLDEFRKDKLSNVVYGDINNASGLEIRRIFGEEKHQKNRKRHIQHT